MLSHLSAKDLPGCFFLITETVPPWAAGCRIYKYKESSKNTACLSEWNSQTTDAPWRHVVCLIRRSVNARFCVRVQLSGVCSGSWYIPEGCTFSSGACDVSRSGVGCGLFSLRHAPNRVYSQSGLQWELMYVWESNMSLAGPFPLPKPQCLHQVCHCWRKEWRENNIFLDLAAFVHSLLKEYASKWKSQQS